MAASQREICSLGIHELGMLYRTRQLSPVEVTKATLDRIKYWNPRLHAFICICENSSLTAAREAEQRFRAGIDLGPMDGIPIAVKDLIRVRGTITTAGSRMLLDAPPDQEDAGVVRRLRNAGSIILGKLNLHEFGRGEPSPDGPFGIVQNPRRIGCHAGGSSSGSAAAVATGLSVIALGTDTGGSVRLPAALCGVVGLKPTYGFVSVRGVIPLSPSLDHVGLIGRSVVDVATSLAVTARWTASHPSVSFALPDGTISGVRFGFPTNPYYGFAHEDALAVFEAGKESLIAKGAVPVPVEIPCAEESNRIAKLITDFELWRYHAQFRGRENLYGRDFLLKSQPGQSIPIAEYHWAKTARRAIRGRWRTLFEHVHVVLLPGNIAGAPHHDQLTLDLQGEIFRTNSVTLHFDRIANLIGFPAICIPAGASSVGLPIALQFIAPPYAEQRLFSVANALEEASHLIAKWGIEPREV